MKAKQFLLWLIILSGCKDNTTINTFEKRIPVDAFGNFNLNYAYTREQVKYANLKVLENGFDSIFVRVWYEGLQNIDKQIIEFHKLKTATSWECLVLKKLYTRGRLF